MRAAHITYLKEMIQEAGFAGTVLEIMPRADEIQRQIPVCVITGRTVTNALDARLRNRIMRLPVEVSGQDGKKYIRYVLRHFKQEYQYQVAFFLDGSGITGELLSTPADQGLIDNCLLYVSLNQYISEGVLYKIGVDTGSSGIITDEAGDDIFKAFVNIIFRDGIYEEEKVEALSGGTLQIVPPLEVENIS